VPRLPATSKITPHQLNSLLKFVLAALQIFDVHECPVVLFSFSRTARGASFHIACNINITRNRAPHPNSKSKATSKHYFKTTIQNHPNGAAAIVTENYPFRLTDRLRSHAPNNSSTSEAIAHTHGSQSPHRTYGVRSVRSP